MDKILQFLGCETPREWIDQALQYPEELLIDHANCEKKAASTALNLIYRYIDNLELLNKMSKLAREELRHFEQVIAIMKKRKVAYRAHPVLPLGSGQRGQGHGGHAAPAPVREGGDGVDHDAGNQP